MKTSRLMRLGAAFVLSLSSLLTILTVPVQATPSTCIWQGQGTDGNFSDATNWTSASCLGPGGVPQSGDSLMFPYNLTSPTATGFEPHNDLTGATFGNITFSGTVDSQNDFYTIDGNSFTLTGGITNSGTGGTSASAIINTSAAVVISGAQTISTTDTAGATELESGISGSGNITQSGSGDLFLPADDSSYSGTITVNGGRLFAGDPNAIGSGGAVINNGADFTLSPTSCSSISLNANLTLNGSSSLTTGDYPNPKLGSSSSCSVTVGATEFGAPSDGGTATFNGSLTLGSDVTFAGTAATTTINGPIIGAHNITVLPGYTGKLVINSSSNGSSTPNGTYTSALFTKTLSDVQANQDVDIWGNNIITIDGQRSDVTVSEGGVLKGTGTLGSLTVDSKSIVAPGHSPGCMTIGALALSGIYQAEIGGTTACTGYDQLKISSGGTVDIGGATLTPSLYNGFVPAVGQSYTIIDNGGSNPVNGTFSGLAEGATFTAQGITFKVTYKGGDGNDVVLTVTSVNGSQVPTKPNTGLRLVAAHPGMALVASALTGTGLIYVSRRLKPASKH